MNLRRATLVFALALCAADAFAGSASTTFNVAGSVIANCSISATGINFTYDPVGLNAVANATNSGTVTVACTKGSAPLIGLDNGLWAGLGSKGPRAMRMPGPPVGYLGYDIYWPGTTTSWINAGPGLFNPGSPTSKAARAFNMDGAALGGQDVAVGSYSDTITATVNF